MRRGAPVRIWLFRLGALCLGTGPMPAIAAAISAVSLLCLGGAALSLGLGWLGVAWLDPTQARTLLVNSTIGAVLPVIALVLGAVLPMALGVWWAWRRFDGMKRS